MPYIKPEDRPMFNTMIDGLINRAREFNRLTMRRLVANIISDSLTSFGCFYEVDETTESIVRALSNRVRCRGDVNYILCRVVLESMKPATGWSYHSLSDAISVMRSGPYLVDERTAPYDSLSPAQLEQLDDCASVCFDAAYEIQRRLLNPYEDKAILKNGDMACFANEDFAYIPALDIDFTMEEMAGGCGGNCSCNVAKAMEAADNGQPKPWEAMEAADQSTPITRALVKEQLDRVQAERQQAIIERAARTSG